MRGNVGPGSLAAGREENTGTVPAVVEALCAFGGSSPARFRVLGQDEIFAAWEERGSKIRGWHLWGWLAARRRPECLTIAGCGLEVVGHTDQPPDFIGRRVVAHLVVIIGYASERAELAGESVNSTGSNLQVIGRWRVDDIET